MPHAIIENKETCAAAECCQPVDREIAHTTITPATESAAAFSTTTRIGYCFRCAARIIRMRLARAKEMAQ